MTGARVNPRISNGRWYGRALERVGIGLEVAGLHVQKWAAWLRWHD